MNCYQWTSFVTASPPSLYLPAVFSDRSNPSSAVCGLGSLFFFFFPSCSIVFYLSCFMCCPTRQLPSSPPLSKHLWAAAGLFCTTLLSSGCRAKIGLAACVSCDLGRGGGGLMPSGRRRMIRTDPIQAQSECRLNVLLL